MIDKEEIVRALTLWFQPGDVFEIRALGASTGLFRNPHTETGYFDFDHIKEAADAIEKIRFADGIYVTVYPVKKNLLARAVYKLLSGKNAAATGDDNIERRHWLLIDCDPVRESGIASNDEEHEYAIEKAKAIREELSKIGWSAPILTDSGNGAHLTYRIDLPTADDGLVQSVLTALQYFNDDKVKIDLSVFNPARIVRLPGTMNRKGDDADGKVCGRPHRLAKIIEAPESIIPVTEEQLKIVLGGEQPSPAPVVPDVRGRVFYEDEGFNLDEWIAKYAPDAGPPIPYNKDGIPGRKWRFKVCPFNPEQTNDPAVITAFNDGGIQFTGLHDSCSGNDWKKFRVLRQPGCYDHKKQLEYPDVDVSGILHQKSNAEKEKQSAPEPEKEIPPWRKLNSADVEKALDGTVLGEMCDLLANVAHPPLPVEAVLPKALVLCGAALSQQISSEDQRVGDGNLKGVAGFGKGLARLCINTGDGQICNFYAMLAAPSGSGKDIGGLVDIMANYFGWFIGNSGSAEGLADAYINIPNGILSISELQPFLDEKCWQHRATEFLTPAFNKGFFKQIFSSRGKGSSTREAPYSAPNVVAFVQPDVFEATAKITDLHSGFLGRFLFTVVPEFSCEANIYDNEEVVKKFAGLMELFRQKRGKVDVSLGYAHELLQLFEKLAVPELGTSWKRLANEYYPRLALVLSVQHDKGKPSETVKISNDSWQRAKILTFWFYGQAEKLLLRINDALPLIKEREKLMRKVFQKIRKLDRGNGVTLKEISWSGVRNSTGKERREALMELEDRGLVAKKENRYSIISTPPEWDD